ncbi:MAG: HD domain-containing protein [Bacilli bacterium]|nr:HD domain-containing protein [Bacilli bacterium]
MNYYNLLNPEVFEYFSILSEEFPSWLLDYIHTDEMQRIGKISMSCGADYSKCFDVKYWYSNLDHSVGVALILWHFTHDKKQTLAGLFHDIATPCFKHCIDFMNGDSEHQESTEERTDDILFSSKEISSLLKRDQLSIYDVNDYKKYPLADNNMPRLSADRFEYNFSSGLTFFRVWDLDSIREIYQDITISKNEDGFDEFAFQNQDVCEKYVQIISRLWPEWISDKDRVMMQFFADMCKSMNNIGYLSIDQLYTLSEKEIIHLFLNCPDSYLRESFQKFLSVDKAYSSPILLKDKYSVSAKSKVRYINPLVLTKDGAKRITEVSPVSKKVIDDFLSSSEQEKYSYFDFSFHPYEEEKTYTKKIPR